MAYKKLNLKTGDRFKAEDLGHIESALSEVVSSNEGKVDSARVEALEALGGLSAESPVDGQTANLIEQEDTLTRAALNTTQDDYFTATSEDPLLGEELVSDQGWTLGDGWSGTYQDGFIYDGVSGGTLSWEPPTLSSATTYLLAFTAVGFDVNNNFPGDISASIAGQSLDPLYAGTGLTEQRYERGFRPTSVAPLVITPKPTTPMTIHSVSLRQVTSGSPAITTWRTPDGEPAAEFRQHGKESLFLGYRAGERHRGTTSVGIGHQALRDDVTGFFNVAVGYNSMMFANRASRCVAIGYQSLADNQSGDRNVGIGSFAGSRLTTGRQNVLIGVDPFYKSDTGDQNIAIGMSPMGEASGVSNNIAVGYYALRYAQSGQDNISIGDFTTQENDPGSSNVAIGRSSLMRNSSSDNVAVGYQAASYASGGSNVAVGSGALKGPNGQNSASRNVVMGFNTATAATTAERNTLLGHNVSPRLTSGHRNTIVGGSSAAQITEAHSNTIIGEGSASALTSGHTNIVVGKGAGTQLTTGSRNILIGGDVRSPALSNFLNIGDTIFGNLATKSVGIGVDAPSAQLHLAASPGTDGTAPIRIDAGTLLTSPKSGCIEFDGTKLYVTIANVRREIALT